MGQRTGELSPHGPPLCWPYGQQRKKMAGRLRQYGIPLALMIMVAGMTGLVSYSVTLYRLFCQVTGAGGTTQRVTEDEAAKAVSSRMVTVFFNADVSPKLPWRFRPLQRSVKVHLGQQVPIFYEAENTSDQDIVGHATFNVTPDKAGIYFKKIECFCFTEERLAAHRSVQMPVLFYVDPAMANDPAMQDVDQITLSYTFFRSETGQTPADLARFHDGPPDAALGKKIFAAQCSGCHEMGTDKEGPRLAGIIGRKAGSVPGYPYSKALAAADFIWDEGHLDRWLAGPAAMLPGAAMPMSIDNPVARRDIIAYLKQVMPAKATEATPQPPTAPADRKGPG
ncbi:Cytochrome c oxidase assembly protein ctaG [Granulibacter bethesdensis]|uniref:Cytochrome c oxidase assembly protein CtaG n=2 Tax=Granulibacter bethesdensis TaxID=364410 RepID=A0AAC9KD85_9PROT|nr:Cytochrome c oxidase assembly protein ctaG [Granulibacter bethesdensis]APH61543.1 Cytochrome c oxidase assembly protein ctaG [Granulibacter bethesdensis]